MIKKLSDKRLKSLKQIPIQPEKEKNNRSGIVPFVFMLYTVTPKAEITAVALFSTLFYYTV
jgi:hypothetical protein